MNRLAFSILIALFTTLSLSVNSTLAAPPDDAAKVLVKLDDDWSKTAATKNAEKVASFYAEDAIAYPPNAPLATGRSGAREVWAGMFADPNFVSITWKTVHAEVAKSGELGYTSGTYVYTAKGSDGKPSIDNGKYLCTWGKQKDGSWKATHDMWNSDTAAMAAASAPLSVERSAKVSVTAKVKAINYETRAVTLQDAAGHEVSLVADKRVQRLNEVKVGDEVTAEYGVAVLGELRPPTADEAAHTIMAVEAAGRAPTSTDPAAAAVRAIKVVTTVQAIDLPNMLVTLQGPMGDRAAIKARNPDNVKKLHVGDTIVVTYAEAIAISLDKATPAK